MKSNDVIFNINAIGLRKSFMLKLTCLCDRIWDSAALMYFLVVTDNVARNTYSKVLGHSIVVSTVPKLMYRDRG